MCHPLLKDSRLWPFLFEIDSDLAQKTREKNCLRCGAILHSAKYPRKPRGGPEELPAEYLLRFSFCCSADGCRCRATPPSVRFLGKKVYLQVVIILITAMRQGPTPPGAARLKELFGVSRQTLDRWQTWWKERFPKTRFWKTVRARFLPPLEVKKLPSTLLERLGAETSLEKFLQLLQFLSPITTPLRADPQAP